MHEEKGEKGERVCQEGKAVSSSRSERGRMAKWKIVANGR